MGDFCFYFRKYALVYAYFPFNFAIKTLSILLKIEVNIVSLLLVGESAAGVDDLSAVDLSVLNVLGSTHNGYIYLSAASYNVVPVDEVDVCKQTEVKLAVLDGKRFASAKEHGAEMSVGIHT